MNHLWWIDMKNSVKTEIKNGRVQKSPGETYTMKCAKCNRVSKFRHEEEGPPTACPMCGFKGKK